MTMSMQDARLIAESIDTMDMDLLTDAYAGIAKLQVDVSEPERQELRSILSRILEQYRARKRAGIATTPPVSSMRRVVGATLSPRLDIDWDILLECGHTTSCTGRIRAGLLFCRLCVEGVAPVPIPEADWASVIGVAR